MQGSQFPNNESQNQSPCLNHNEIKIAIIESPNKDFLAISGNQQNFYVSGLLNKRNLGESKLVQNNIDEISEETDSKKISKIPNYDDKSFQYPILKEEPLKNSQITKRESLTKEAQGIFFRFYKSIKFNYFL